MSKKKATGNTMTLKDFHGGSIPTDLPLPSAPGVIIRPSDRPGYDRPTSWGNQMGRSDHRSRPHTSPAMRNFDDKAPFLTHTSHIGRNFDEDERKPLDGVSAPRRTISDESIRVAPTRAELKQESASAGGSWGRQGVGPTSQVPTGAANSYSGRVTEGTHGGLNYQNLDTNVGQGAGGAYPNAWAVRKEAAGSTERLQSAWSAPVAVSKLAHASALEKVSSGRWQSKLSTHNQTDAEPMRSPENENGLHSKGYGNNSYNKVDAIGGIESYDASLARHAERGLNIDDNVQGGRKEIPDYERARTPTNPELKDRDRGQPDHTIGRLSGTELQNPTHLEPAERPKLKLLPRTKPLETLEPHVVDHIQGYQQVTESVHTDNFKEVPEDLNPSKSALASTEIERQAIERPKLNLKPRSQPVEQIERNTEKGRNLLFGGARPRELVLKERGIDDVASQHELVQQPERVEVHVPRSERISGHANSLRYTERTENPAFDQRTGKKGERKERDHRVDVERGDTQRRNWRSDNRRNNRETEKQQQQQQQLDRAPSPETWRKPIEPPKPSSGDSAGMRYGKAASAIELAQAFSRSSVSDPPGDRHSGQRSLPGRTQMPFSRLMSPTQRPQINGY
ncbi:eukaryotic translation initiation factor-like protein [Trema orientale]|uniref:Eukaryotic translation initiation factor-like protein n=1 Tax=Trema orientale TaxID=63057 RepID=A0A2P5CUT5_TREOI|nr:eukaryotic translation initiation factor-like protein [Trema orientale]